MAAWMWLAAGLALIALEAAGLGGLVLGFLGLGALATAAGEALGMVPQLWQQALLAGVGAVACMGLLRGRLQARLAAASAAPAPELAGEPAATLAALAPGQRGQVMLRGSPWQALHVGTRPLRAGEPCEVVATEGLTLQVREAHLQAGAAAVRPAGE